MNRWKKAAMISAFAAAAMIFGSPVMAAMNTGYQTETAAINVANHFPGNMATGIAVDTPLTVEFAGPVSQSFYQSINFSLFNGTQPIDGELFYNPAARQVMFKAKQPLNAGETYTAQISYFDGLGRNADKVWSFRTLDNNVGAYATAATPQPAAKKSSKTPLVLTNASMGAGTILPDLPLEVSFSEPLDVSTLKQAPVQLLENNKQVPVDYKLSRDLKTVTVTPRSSLKSNVNYAIAVEKSLASSKGSSLTNRTLIPFKIAGSYNDTQVASHEINESPEPVNNYANYSAPPVQQAQYAQYQTPQQPQFAEPAQITGLSPQNGAKVTNLTQPITIAFNCDIKPETLNEFTFRLEDDFGPVPAKIHYFEANRQATLTPVGLLENGKNYRVIVTQGITDVSGRPLKNGVSSMFATISPASAPSVPAIPANTMTASAGQYQQSQKQQAAYRQQPTQQQNYAQNTYAANVKHDAAELEALDNGNVNRNYASNANYGGNTNVANPYSQNQYNNFNSAVNGAQASSYRQAMSPADRTVRNDYQQPNGLTQFKVTSIFPASDANNISRKSKIALHFSEQADPKTVNNINISVFANQTRVDGKVTYDRKNNRAVFEPERQLDPKTEYKVIVSNKILSKMGEPLANRVSWQFSTAETEKKVYQPVKSMEADAAFYIPLADSKVKPTQSQLASMQNGGSSGSVLNIVPQKHWSFKSVRHISNKGILPNFPFSSTNNVSRYEFASAINSALSNLKTMQSSQSSKLKVADMVQLEQLICEYRPELKSYGVNTSWFETFLKQQGINLQQVEEKVRSLN